LFLRVLEAKRSMVQALGAAFCGALVRAVLPFNMKTASQGDRTSVPT
jgi:hypothetical protein